MKIAVINNLYPPFNRGGAEKIAYRQVDELKRQGHQVFVITSRPLFKRFNLSARDYKIYYFYPWNIFSIFNLNKFPWLLRAFWRLIDIFNLTAYWRVKKILRQERPDAVYAHNLTGLSYLLPRLFKKMKIKHVQFIHDVALIHPSGLLFYGRERLGFLNKFYLTLTKYLFGSPDEVIFPSQWIKKYYESYGFFPHSRRQAIKNFSFKQTDLLTDKKLKANGRINFLYLGQIEKHKGILFLIRAFNALPPEFHKYSTLSVLGDGRALAQAKKIAASNSAVKFYGHQPPDKVKKFFEQSDYLIVSSLCYENSPTVIFEALSAGVPVIASALGGIPELVSPGLNGYLFKPDEEAVLTELLKKIFYKHFKNFSNQL